MPNLNETPSSERLHIGFFGCRNAGKSSLVNAVTGQCLSIVSEVKGTTTDPVKKSMELLPLGPVVIIDTPGLDDIGLLGELRIRKAEQILSQTDIAVLVVDATGRMGEYDRDLVKEFQKNDIPFLIAFNKCDLLSETPSLKTNEYCVSATEGIGIEALKDAFQQFAPKEKKTPIIGDLLSPGDPVILVCPIDESAPKGRMILPQQQTIRDILDFGATAMVVKETDLAGALDRLKEPPKLVVTDSQALSLVSKVVPEEVPLTTFSILMARYKGFLSPAVSAIAKAASLEENSWVLMAEGCTHHRQCNDIGTIKIPKMLQEYCGRPLQFETCSGNTFPEDLSPYSLIIHCGACMNTDRDLRQRLRRAIRQGVPFTNYGIALAQMTGTLERTLRPLPEIHKLLEP